VGSGDAGPLILHHSSPIAGSSLPFQKPDLKRPFINEEIPPRPFHWAWNRSAGRLEPVAKERPTLVRRRHWGVAAFLSAAGLIYGSLLPFRFQALTIAQGWREFQQLWSEGGPAGYSSQDVAVNVLIAVPLAFSLMGALLLHRRRTLILVAGTVATLAACIVVSFAVEFAQVWIDTRVSSLRDVAAQVTGAAVGCILWLAFGRQLSKKLDEFLGSRESSSRVVWLLNAYVVGLLVWSLLPFDLVTSMDEIARKYQRGQIEIVPFTFRFSTSLEFWYSVLSQTVLFIPLGIWATVAWLPRKSSLRGPWHALAVCLCANAAMELAQLFVKSRYTSSRDVLMGTLGSAIGIVGVLLWNARRRTDAARRTSPLREAGFWFVASVAYLLFLLGIAWSPFDFSRDRGLIRERLHAFVDVPFRSLQASGSDLGAMFHIIREFAWYIPLGMLFALVVFRSSSSSRRRTPLLGLAAIALTACAVASVLGQLLLPGKTVDLTEAIIRASGGLGGLAAATLILSRWTPRTTTVRPRPDAFRAGESPDRKRRDVRGMDGIRAMAALAVFGVHFQQLTGVGGHWGPFDLQRLLENGNTGVAVFFLLSGFLLSRPLWSARGTAGFDAVLDGFARRRFLRIVPAYFLCLTALVLWSRHWRSASERLDTLLHYLFLHNMTEQTIYGISHPFWALAVIAQFYVVFWLLVRGLRALGWHSERRMVDVFLAVGVVGWLVHFGAVRYAQSAGDWPFASFIQPHGYVLTHSLPAHLPHFMLGVLGAWLFAHLGRAGHSRDRLSADLLFWLSAVAVLLILSTPLDDRLQVPLGRYHLPFVPVLLLAMIVSAPRSRFTARLLEWGPLRGLGVVSYGFYIYHLPCLGVVRRTLGLAGLSPGESPLAFLTAGIVTSTLVATASYLGFERFFLRRKRPANE
jgi:peptidoglycan/LPS O-acetylase OafA/YrhL